jgi:hypothetical protein
MEKTNTTEIKRLIRSLKPKKSAGFDQISNFMIKKLPLSYIDCLVNCFNEWLANCRYSAEWKIARNNNSKYIKSRCSKMGSDVPDLLTSNTFKKFWKANSKSFERNRSSSILFSSLPSFFYLLVDYHTFFSFYYLLVFFLSFLFSL